MAQEFSDEQIRIELKRMVEDFQSATLSELNDVVSQAEGTLGATEQQVGNVRDKIEAAKMDLSLRTRQIMDFIDRQ
ncbi:hypothetical protein SH584_07380 [Sphingomonas sp. LY29]|uniref:hypothetical protein n=1 Tax=Sphingomonas sp. LY29 TaxID=3095341 RepID=UPI002D76FDCA|nr:hypothetical protein [Sphingomonas sp. LY29]WRP24884.1 hypothetical protein SH584_07380 [Sphingomonas sp. LY29]